MPKFPKVYLEYGTFATILSASIETYPKETFGFIGGLYTGKRIILNTSTPLQTANRAIDKVMFSDRRRYRRLKDMYTILDVDLYGSYHSHPKSFALPSETDLEHSTGEIYDEEFRFKYRLDIIIAIKKRKFKETQNLSHPIDCTSQAITGKIKYGKKGYEYKIAGYWVSPEETPEEYRGTKLVRPNLYTADLYLVEKTLPSTWKREYVDISTNRLK